MSITKQLKPEDIAFLEPYLPPDYDRLPLGSLAPPEPICNPSRPGWLNFTRKSDDLPWVTLAYASSLDSMIALAPGTRTTLSGEETKAMTHYLRWRHEAVLIGAGTAVADDPALNCRYPGVQYDDQPRPVIIDPNGRFFRDGKKIFDLADKGKAREPYIVCRSAISNAENVHQRNNTYQLMIPDYDTEDPNGPPISWTAILKKVREFGMRTVMVEGGATIINALLAEPDLVDAVVLTIAPTFLGDGGVRVAPAARTDEDGMRINAASLHRTAWRQFGHDVVLCGRLRR